MTDRGDDKDVLVSVVIPSYNSENTIAATLNSIYGQHCNFSFEVIVVDSSGDSTPKIVKDVFPGVKLFHLSQQTLAATARNLGADKASGRFFVFLDSDCLVEPQWLQMMVDNYSEEYCGIGGPIDNANPETSISWAGYLLEFSDFLPCSSLTPVPHIPSGNLLLLREHFIEAGGFPESFYFAQEDRLFSWILTKKTGKHFLFHPGIKVSHNHRPGLRQFLAHQYQIGRGGAEILKNTDLPGSKLVHHKVLINLLLPLLPFKKLCRCLVRTIRFQPRLLISKPQIIPLMILGQLFWISGFGGRVNADNNSSQNT